MNETEIEALKRTIERERKARKEAEKLLEEKTRELYNANQALQEWNLTLEQKFAERTKYLLESRSELSSTYSRLGALITSLQTATLIEDENGKVSHLNQKFCEYFDLPFEPEQLIGSECDTITSLLKNSFPNPELYELEICRINSEKKPLPYQELHLKNGKILERSYTPIISNGQYLGHLWNFRDITEKKMWEKKIEELSRFPEENPNPVIRFSNNGEILYSNKISETVLTDLIRPENEALYNSIIKEITISAETKEDKYLENKINGHYYTWFITPIPAEEYINVYITDITERKNAEESLEKSRQLVQKITDTIPQFIYIYRFDTGELVYVNKSLPEMLGYSSSEDQKEEIPLNSLVHPESLQEMYVLGGQLDQLKDGQVQEHTYRLKHQNGNYIWFLRRETIFRRDENGRPIEILGSAEDITAQKIAEQKIQELKDFYESILNNLPAEVVALDHNFRYTFVNPAAVKNPEVRLWIIGKNDYEYCEFRNKPIEQAQLREKKLISVAETHQLSEWEDEITLQNGEKQYMLRRLSPVTDANQNLKMIIGYGLDITSRIRYEQEIARKEAKYRALLSAIPDNMYVISSTGLILDTKIEDETAIQVSKEKLIGSYLHDILPAGVAEKITDSVASVLQYGGLNIFEYEVKADQQSVYFEGRLAKYKQDEALLIVRNITTKKKAILDLEQQQAFIRQVLDTSPTFIFVKDWDGKIVFCNPAFAGLFDLTVEEVVDCYNIDLLPRKTENEKFTNDDHYVISTGREITKEETVTLKNGDKRWIYTIKRPFVQPDGTVHVLGISSDITERKKAEQKLLTSEKRLRNLINYSQAIITTHDMQGRLLSVNPALVRLIGYSEEEMIGRSISDFLAADKVEFFPYYLEQFQHNKKTEGIMKIYTKQGETKFLLYQNYKLEEPGVDPYIIAFAQDITDRMMAERELRTAKEAAEISAKAKENFLANMSHEIRTPMNGILGMAGLLSKTNLDPAQQSYLKIIRNSAENLLVIINDILDVAKIESGKLKLEQIPFNIQETIRAAQQTLIYKAEEKDLAFNVLPFHINNPMLIGDPYRLTQVLLNLLNNAIKFTDAGEVELSVEVLEETATQVTIKFMVRDTGIGIPKDKLDLIFEGFTQAYTNTTRKYGGTGLGLTISKNLVEMQGGRIWVESTEGKGSTFHFILTFRKNGIQQQADDLDQTPELQNLGPLHILLAEDNEVNQFLAVAILEGWNFQVDVAENGREALELFSKKSYDIVLMDIQMPEMSGIEATKHIRNLPDPEKASVPIIALTANALKGDAEKYLSAGMNDYLSKPFEEEVLYQKIARNLKHKTVVGAAPATEAYQDEKSAAALIDIELYNLSMLEKMSRGNKEFVSKMIRLFLQTIPTTLEDISKSLHANDWDNVAALAHKLKPSFDTLGIALLKDDIRTIEALAKKREHLSEIEYLVNKLHHVLGIVMAQLQKELR